jgi:hypothetical protein
MNKIFIVHFTFLLLLISCSDYEHIKENFFKDSHTGKIYYESKGEKIIGSVFIEVTCNIDFDTMEINDSFILDKNSVFCFYETSCGTFIYEFEEADRAAFRVLEGGYYGMDKNHLYAARGMVIDDVDLTTFETIIPTKGNYCCMGRDKNNIYLFDEKIHTEEKD